MPSLSAARRWLSRTSLLAIGLLVAGAAPPIPKAPAIDPSLYAGLRWRNIGPHRAGRVTATSGAIGQAGVYYAGTPIGGVWKTTSAGMTWFPIFDSIKEVSSIGSLEVAPSDPNIIYVGTGDVNEGNGVYKSTDAGETWQHLGMDATRQIPSILVDPKDPNVVLMAAQGSVRTQEDMRGVFRSTDGGKTWSKTLFVNNSTGVMNMAWAFDNPNVILAVAAQRVAPGLAAAPAPGGGGVTSAPAGRGGGTGRSGAPPAAAAVPTGGNAGQLPTTGTTMIFKSVDEGKTWQELKGAGVPALSGRVIVAVAMHSNSQRMYLIGTAGLFRSDDGGTSWRQVAAEDTRIRGGEVYVSAKSPDIVYTLATCSYMSTNGGETFAAYRCSPGGDDPREMWIDPTDSRRMFIGFDQGASLTIDGGKTWSSWYNQPTSQVYHIAVDNSSPYWVYASQQDACGVQVRSRGTLGSVTMLDWFPTPGYEWGGIAVDPLNPNRVYVNGSTNDITRITYPTGEWMNVAPNVDASLGLRTGRDQMLEFNKSNAHELLLGYNVLMASLDGGMHWKKLSPDLGIPKGQPAGAGGGGTISTIASSSVSAGTIWAGTNNGLIHVTKDHGATWTDVSIPAPLGLIANIDASHQDPGTAYVAARINGDVGPGFWRTHDYGKTWTKIVNGLRTDQPSGTYSRVIRTDPKKAGLLFAGTESAMYVSFNDGDDWESLMLNLPNTSYRDALVKDNDLVVGTYGRSIWILDDISPLRQMAAPIASEPVHLFKPGDAVRYRRSINAGTPLQKEIPHGENPPLGAVIYYQLNRQPAGEITLDVLDAAGQVVRHLSSAPIQGYEYPPPPPVVPDDWIEVPEPMPKSVGNHRVNWDLRYDAPPAFIHTIAHVTGAVPGATPWLPEGFLALPGVYTIKLTVDGKSYTQTVTVKNDPHSPASPAELLAQHQLQMKLLKADREAWEGYHQVQAMRSAVAKVQGKSPAVDAAAPAFDAKLAAVGGTPNLAGRGGRGGGGAMPPNFAALSGYEAEEGAVLFSLTGQLKTLEYGDMAPSEAKLKAWALSCSDLKSAVTTWRNINAQDLQAFNRVLTRSNLAPIPAASPLAVPVCPGAAVAAAPAPAAPSGRGAGRGRGN